VAETGRKFPAPDHDRLKHAFDVIANIRIGEAQHEEALRHESGIPNGIGLRIMRIAVDLDDESYRRTEEVDDVRRQNNLTPKFQTVELRRFQPLPKLILERRRLAAHGAGAIAEIGPDT